VNGCDAIERLAEDQVRDAVVSGPVFFDEGGSYFLRRQTPIGCDGPEQALCDRARRVGRRSGERTVVPEAVFRMHQSRGQHMTHRKQEKGAGIRFQNGDPRISISNQV
jgi:hypothetical protein